VYLLESGPEKSILVKSEATLCVGTGRMIGLFCDEEQEAMNSAQFLQIFIWGRDLTGISINFSETLRLFTA